MRNLSQQQKAQLSTQVQSEKYAIDIIPSSSNPYPQFNQPQLQTEQQQTFGYLSFNPEFALQNQTEVQQSNSNSNNIINADSKLLRDKEFRIKKFQSIKALCLLFIMQLSKMILFAYLWNKMGQRFEILALFTTPLFFSAYLGSAIINMKVKFYNIFTNILMFILLIFFESFFLFSLTRLFRFQQNDKLISFWPYYDENNIYAQNLTTSQILGLLFILINIIYLLVERTQIKTMTGYVFFITCIITIVFIEPIMFVGYLISIIYGMLLFHSLSEIMKGKFQIVIGEVLQMTVTLSIGMYLPCNL